MNKVLKQNKLQEYILIYLHSLTICPAPLASELEVDERLNIAALNLNDDVDYNDHEQRLSNERHLDNCALTALNPTVGNEVQQIAQKHERHHSPVALNKLPEYLRLEVAENQTEHRKRVVETCVAEENPAQTHEMERNNNAHGMKEPSVAMILAEAHNVVPQAMGCQGKAVHRSPCHEVPRSTMPQSAHKHRQNQIDVSHELALAVSAKRDVDIIAQPTRQRDVPSVPELGNRRTLVRAVEVLRKVKSEQKSNSDSHIAVARKVAVNLKGKTVDSEQILQARIERRVVENSLDKVDAYIVADDCFLEQSGNNQEQSFAKCFTSNNHLSVYLRNEITRPYDWSGNQLREEAYEEGIVEQTVERLQLSSVHIDCVAERLEGEERYSDRQHDIERFEVSAGNISPYCSEEISVLEVDEERHIDKHAEPYKEKPLPLLARRVDAMCHNKVEARYDGKNLEVSAAALVVKIVRESSYEQQSRRMSLTQKRVDAREGKKQEKEQSAAEDELVLLVIVQQQRRKFAKINVLPHTCYIVL